MRESHKLEVLAFSTLLLLATLTYIRIYYGVDFTDEAFYLALPYRFILGDRPILDDYSVAQSAGILLVPVYKLFHYFSPDNTGVFIYFRHLFLIFYLIVTFFIARLFTEIKSSLFTLLIASPFFLFMPFGIPNLGYNTIGSGLFALALAISTFRLGRSGPWVFGTGVLHSLAVISYPPLFPASIVTLIPVLYFMKKKRFRTFFTLLSGAIFTSAIVYFLIGASVQEYLNTMQQIFKEAKTSNHHLGFEKFKELATQLWLFRPKLEWIAVQFIFVLFIKKYFKKAAFLPLISFILMLFFSTRASQGGGGHHYYILYYVLLTPLFIPLIKFDGEFLKLLFSVYFPSIFAGLCMSVASNNGAAASANILILDVAVIQFILFKSVQSIDNAYEAPLSYLKNFLFILLNCALLLRFQYTTIFQDDKMSELKVKIESGPYKYLRTTENKAKFLEDIRLAINKLEIHTGIIVFLPHFPAGYLLTGLQPGTHYLFGSCDPFSDLNCKEVLNPRVLVRLSKLFYTNDRIYEFSEGKLTGLEEYKVASSAAHFKLYLKN